MATRPDSNSFFVSPTAYDQFMGRYARPLAREFVNVIPLSRGDTVLDIGCGPGALTGELVEKVGAEAVSAIDPSPSFLEYCASEYPGITASVASAEQIPFADDVFDAVLSQLVIHFIGDLQQAGREIMRVTKAGGHVAVCTWNLERMEKINLLPRAANAVGINVPDLRTQEFHEEGSVALYLESIGLIDIEKTTITVSSVYSGFEELWSTYLGSVGPLGPWTISQNDDVKDTLKQSLFDLLGEPAGEITLSAEARVAVGRVPE